MTIVTFVITAGGKATIQKDPNARKAYGIDLVDVLAENHTTIASVEIASVAGVSVDGSIFTEGSIAAIWVTGGAVDAEAFITFRYTLSDGTVDDQTIHFDIKPK